MPTGTSLTGLRIHLATLRRKFLAAAKGANHGDYKRLKLAFAGRDKPEANAPTLAEFQREHDPDNFYPEAELLEMYVAAYPSAGQKRRAGPANAAVEAAFGRVASLVQLPPRGEDNPLSWLDGPAYHQLLLAGLHTLKTLALHVGAHGYHWYAGIEGIGRERAAHVVGFLRDHQSTIGIKLPDAVLIPPRAYHRAVSSGVGQFGKLPKLNAGEGIAPFERLLPPLDDLPFGDGPAPSIEARDDIAAINTFLEIRTGRSRGTRASYELAIGRFYVWCTFARRKTLRSFKVDDCRAYMSFLTNIPEAWRAPRNTPRSDPAWRPFDGPCLAPSTFKTQLVIVKSLFAWLATVRYLPVESPWDSTPIIYPDADSTTQVGSRQLDISTFAPVQADRTLTRSQIEALLDYVAQLPPSLATSRAQFACLFAYSTGLRLSELVTATVGSLVDGERISGNSRQIFLRVIGKRDKQRAVPMSQLILETLSTYLAARGLGRDVFAAPPNTPLIASLSPRRGNRVQVRKPRDLPDGIPVSPYQMSPSALYKEFKNLFLGCAEWLRVNDRSREAADLSAASTHWLRHSKGSHSLNPSGDVAPTMTLPQAQLILGHSNLNTTGLYVRPDMAGLHAAVEAFDLAIRHGRA